MNPILNNEDLTNRKDELSGKNCECTIETGAADNAAASVCNNSVCMVTWKPVRTAAA